MVIDHTKWDDDTQRILDGMTRIPRGRNPVMRAMRWWQLYLRQSWQTRPKVGSGGMWQGSYWRPLAPQYVRKDGTRIPVYGGVKRVAVGRVTRASLGRIRQGKGTTKKEREAGYGLVRVGQTFGANLRGNVKGKLKRDGTRYTAGDKIGGRVKGDNPLKDFLAPPTLSPSGKTATISSPKRWARRMHEMRPFVHTLAIQAKVRRQLVKEVMAWVDDLKKKGDM